MLKDKILEIADGVENVVLHRDGSDRYDEIVGALARRTKARNRHGETPLVPCQWTTWHLPESGVNKRPVPGDEILDTESNRWIVTEIEYTELSGTLRCVSCRFDTTFGLDEYADLFRRRSEPAKSGTLEYRWFLVCAGIPIKFFETINSDGGITSRTAALRTPVDIRKGDRLRFPDGGYWSIENVVLPHDERRWTELKLQITNNK